MPLKKLLNACWHVVKAPFVRLALPLLLLATLHLDPFGVHSASAEQSSESHFRITAPFYRSDAQSRITVVLIDDAFLDRIGASWPLDYASQGNLLRKILGFEPAAVFVDLLYERPHAGAVTPAAGETANPDLPADLLDALGAARERIANGTIPLMVAALPPEGADSSCAPEAKPATAAAPRLIEEFRSAGLRPVYAGWTGCGSGYPLMLHGDPGRPTAAFALYRDVSCRDRASEGCRDARNPDAQVAAHAFRKPMVVVWGAIPSAAHVQLARQGGLNCQSSEAGWVDRVLLSGKQLIEGAKDVFAWSKERGHREICPFTDVVSASWLLGPHGETVRPFFKDRIVLIGTHVAGVGDLARNPVNGQVPGVLVHAMALDNLVSKDSNYTKPFPKWLFVTLEVVILCLLCLLVDWLARSRITWVRKVADPYEAKSAPVISAILWGVFIGYLCAVHAWIYLVLVVILFIGWDLYQPAATASLALQSCAGLILGLLISISSDHGPINWAGVVIALIGKAALEHGSHGPKLSKDSLLRRGWNWFGGRN